MKNYHRVWVMLMEALVAGFALGCIVYGGYVGVTEGFGAARIALGGIQLVETLLAMAMFLTLALRVIHYLPSWLQRFV